MRQACANALHAHHQACLVSHGLNLAQLLISVHAAVACAVKMWCSGSGKPLSGVLR